MAEQNNVSSLDSGRRAPKSERWRLLLASYVRDCRHERDTFCLGAHYVSHPYDLRAFLFSLTPWIVLGMGRTSGFGRGPPNISETTSHFRKSSSSIRRRNTNVRDYYHL